MLLDQFRIHRKFWNEGDLIFAFMLRETTGFWTFVMPHLLVLVLDRFSYVVNRYDVGTLGALKIFRGRTEEDL